MTPTHAAALESARDSFGMLKEIVTNLPDEAIRFVPVPEGNSLAVLAAHAIAATRFLYACGSGQASSFTAYRTGERAASFEVEWATAPVVAKAIDDALEEFATILAGGTDANLGEVIAWPDEADAPVRSGALCLVHGAAHLREHVGHAELTRDVWNARQGAS